MLSRNFKTAAYLDDFILLSNSKAHCQEGLNVLISLLRDLGFAIAWPKFETPTQELKFLAILINSKSMSLHLPEEKVDAFKSQLNLFKTQIEHHAPAAAASWQAVVGCPCGSWR